MNFHRTHNGKREDDLRFKNEGVCRGCEEVIPGDPLSVYVNPLDMEVSSLCTNISGERQFHRKHYVVGELSAWGIRGH